MLVRPKDVKLAQQLEAGLSSFDSQSRALPGIKSRANRTAFVEQLVESIRRIKYISVIRSRKLSSSRADPSSDIFDPIMAAVLRMREGQIDEAFWFVFLFVHFGKHQRDGWRLVRDVYGRLGRGAPWDWTRTSAHPERFRKWLANYQAHLKRAGITCHFGNHRKYQSLDANKSAGTGAAFESYVEWVDPPRTHQMLFQEVYKKCDGDPKATFDYLYRSMNDVVSFGRMAKFDYLTMVGKLGLAPIEPGSTYMQGATGPVSGARLLFGGNKNAPLKHEVLETWLGQLGARLNVGMQVLEDALCNWQKSPSLFKPFRG